MDNTFTNLGLNSQLEEGLKKLSITNPTEIQGKVIPELLLKKDLIFQSETGSGKTFAYLLPIFQNININDKTQTIILAPTHELASQIKTQVELLAKNSNLPISYALIIGEVNIKRQIDKLKEKPHIIIGSAGRILELIEKKKINASNIKNLVIDEADRMLDKTNVSTVKKVLNITSKEKQTILVSATISDRDISEMKEYLKEINIIRTESENTIPDNIEHYYYVVEYKNKVETLRKLVKFFNPERALVFIQKGDDIKELVEFTGYHGLKAGSLLGTNQKEERKKIIEDFKKGTIQLLFATDIAARGLDIKNVSHVFNLDLNRDAKSYLHRVGRTGRQEQKGMAISIITKDQKELLDRISKNFNIKIEQIIPSKK
ncbi:MAG: DEAD/DEAH box helicase [Candidatus Sericytochromatia bacterium]